jgi:hypothetical protein
MLDRGEKVAQQAARPIVCVPFEQRHPETRWRFLSGADRGPKPSRLAVTEIRNSFEEKPTEDAERATGVLDERETETAMLGTGKGQLSNS